MLERPTMFRLRAALLALLVSPGAFGQDAAPETPEMLFKAGRDAMRQGDFTAACPKFAESQRREPAKGTLLNLALCEEGSRRLLDARRHLVELVDLADLDDARRALALEHLAALEKRTPHLILRLKASDTEGIRVGLDGRELPAPVSTEPIALDPGRHVLRVTSDAGPAREVILELREGADTVLEELPAPLPPVELPHTTTSMVVDTPAPPPPEGARPGPLPYVLGAVGLLGLATSAVTGILVIDRASTVDAHCERKACDAEGLSAGKSGKTFSAVSTASFVAGASLTGIAAYLLLTSGGDPTSPKASATLAPGAVGASLAGTFR